LVLASPVWAARDQSFPSEDAAIVQVLGVQERSGEAAEALLELLLSLDNTQANFVQTLLDFRGQILDQSSGSLSLSKPNLRWQIASPFMQVILVTQDQLRIYDPDLEQVIEKNMAGSDEALPLQLLLDPKQLLVGDYIISHLESDESQQFLLQPVKNQSLFLSVRLAFTNKQLSQLEITDHVGQRTRITFANVRSAVEMPFSTFELDLPAGTDVVRGC